VFPIRSAYFEKKIVPGVSTAKLISLINPIPFEIKYL
jgi:hypothetical protein